MRVAVVSGASSGIGAELVRQLRTRGYVTIGLSRRDSDADEHETCDVSDHPQVEAVAARVLERHPAIELLVCNAGVRGRGGFLTASPERIEGTMRTNYLGSVWLVLAFLPGLGRGSHVVNVVSVAGSFAAGPYSASKHAQLAFSRAAAAELRGERIRVHTVKPGFTETEGFPQSWLPGPAQRLVIGPEDVATHVLRSLEKGQGETTVPWYYGPIAPLQDAMPNVFTRVLGGTQKAP